MLSKTSLKSVREEHYVHSNYIAEFWCTLSNIGLLYVSCKYCDYTALFATTFSILSHAYPVKILHSFDLIGVAILILKILMNRKFIFKWDFVPRRESWDSLGPSVFDAVEQSSINLDPYDNVFQVFFIAMIINIIDTVITRKYLHIIGPSIHVIWRLRLRCKASHFYSAYSLFVFNESLLVK